MAVRRPAEDRGGRSTMAGATTGAELDPALVAAFERDGFVVVPDLLAAAERDRYGRAVDAAVPRWRSGDNRPLADRARDEQAFVQCINLWEDRPDVRPLTVQPAIARTAAALLRVD